MTEVLDFIDPSLIRDVPPTRQVESLLYGFDRRLPHVLKGVLYPAVYNLVPNWREKTISCEGTKVRVLSRSNTEWYITGNPYDEGVCGVDLVRLLQSLGGEGEFLDVGASTGMYTTFAVRCGVGVSAFEPDSQMFRILGDNVRKNRCGGRNPWLFHGAIDETCGVEILHSDGFKEACPSLAKTGNQVGQIPVETYSLDILIDQQLIPEPNVIKIDVEGAEERVLKGGIKMLTSGERDLFIEIHPQFLPLFNSSAERVWDLITELGYNPLDVVIKGEEFVCHFKNS